MAGLGLCRNPASWIGRCLICDINDRNLGVMASYEFFIDANLVAMNCAVSGPFNE